MLTIKIFGFEFKKEIGSELIVFTSILIFIMSMTIIIRVSKYKEELIGLEKFKIEQGITNGESGQIQEGKQK